MGKWEKTIVIFGVVISLILLVRRAKASDIQLPQVKVKNITKKLKRHPTREYAKRELEQINNVVIHHSATKSGTPQSYARYHVDTHGWPGIGYHYVIQKDGTIYQTNELDTISFHVSGHNTRSIGICLTGHYDQQAVPEIQLQQCGKLIASLRSMLPKEIEISGHRDFSTKSCPGDKVDIGYLKSLADGYRNVIV